MFENYWISVNTTLSCHFELDSVFSFTLAVSWNIRFVRIPGHVSLIVIYQGKNTKKGLLSEKIKKSFFSKKDKGIYIFFHEILFSLIQTLLFH